MRVALIVALLAHAHAGAADPMLSEWSADMKFRPAEQLAFGACTLDVTVRGAIVELEMKQVIRNPGNTAMAGQLELDVPAKAEMIGASFDATAAIGVAVNPAIEGASDAVAADPMLVVRDGVDNGNRRFRVMLQPVRAQHEVTVGVRWTITAEIYNGALHAALPKRLDRSTCAAKVKAQPGPGATANVAQPQFVWGADDTTIEVALALGKAPVAWLQTMELGNGDFARALTVIAPAIRAETGAHRVVFAIDTSRSMELIGRGNVRRMVKAIIAALPQGAEVQAVLFDRTAERATKTWMPAETSVAAIDAALAKRGAVNGSDLAGAFELVKAALAEPGDTHGQAMVIAITDGVFGGISNGTLEHALGGRADTLDLHAIVLDPTGMTSPDGDALQPLVGTYGGTFVEVPLDDLDHAIADVAEWLRPAWQNLELTGMAGVTLPEQIRAGTGFVQWSIGPRPHTISPRVAMRASWHRRRCCRRRRSRNSRSRRSTSRACPGEAALPKDSAELSTMTRSARTTRARNTAPSSRSDSRRSTTSTISRC
jgi:Mg-chelatase subunit ChlD